MQAAMGDRAISVGGDAINSLLVTGDHNTFFVGRYERLADAFLDPRALLQELNLDAFVGREWLQAEVDAFLRTHERGYLILEAEAGMGKTAFLARLAQQHGYAHHAVRLMPDPRDAAVAVKNLAAQLIRAWDLTALAVGGVLPPGAGRPDFLQEVLEQAASARDALRPGEPIVLVVDGLNETVAAPGQNPLGLPALLPAGVFVIASQRPVHVPLRLEVPRVIVTLDADGEGNRDDLQRYLAGLAQRPEIRRRLDDSGVAPESFVRKVFERSQGVWVYVHYVESEIATGMRSPADLDALPVGLWQYYARFWQDWQDTHPDRWADVDLPLLALLAAVAEPVPAVFLARRIGQRTSVVEARLEEQWRPFVQVDDTADEPTYRPFHDSLRDFCHGDVDLAQLSAAERSMARRLARATREAHADLAESFLTTWGGLPGLPATSTDDGHYGMAHLVEHLDLSGRDDDLHALLMRSGADGSNLWFTAQRRAGGVGAYRRDVTRAGEVATRSSRPLTLALRYTLILAALNSVVAVSPPAAWARLTAEGRLTLAEALAQARQIPEAPERAEALTLLADRARPPLREEVQREALAAVAAIGDGFWRVGELWRLYPGLEPGLRADASALVEAIADPYYRVVAQRLIGRDADVSTLAATAAGDHEALDSPSGLAASSQFVQAYTRRRDIAAQLLGSAGFGRGSDAGVPRLWANHLALLSSSGDELGEGIGDDDAVLASWCALGTAVALLGPADVDADVDAVASSIVDDRWRWAFLAGAGRDVTPAREADLVAGLRAVVGVVDAAAARWEAWVAGVSDPIERCRLRLALVERLTDAPGRALLADAVLTDLARTPAAPADLLTGAVRGCRPAALERARDLAARLEEPAVVSAAIGHRLVDGGDLDAATEVLAGLPPPWSWDLGHAIARARARAGDAVAAGNLAAALPFAPWRAAVQAELVSTTDAVVIEPLVTALPPDSRAASLAGAAVLAPPGTAERLLLIAAAEVAAVDDPAERDLAHLAVGTALALRGRLREALTTAAAISGHQVRARAEVTVLGQLARGLADLDRDDVLAVLAADPMTDADSLVAVRAAVLATTPPGPGTEAAASALLVELRRRPRATTLQHLPALLAAIRTVDGPTSAVDVAHDLTAVCGWWP